MHVSNLRPAAPNSSAIESRLKQKIRIAAGVLAVSVFGALAIDLVPADPRPAGELVAAGIVMAIGLLLVPVVYAYRGTERAFRAEHIVSIGLFYWLLLDIIQGVEDVDLSQEVTQQAFLAIVLTAVGIWIGSAFGPRRLPSRIGRMLDNSVDNESLFRAGVLCFALGMLKFLIPTEFDIFEAVSFIGAPRWSAPWGRGQLGGLDAFWDHLQYFGYVVPTLAVAYGVRRGWYSIKTVMLLTCAVVMVLFLSQSGGRRIVGVTVGSAMLCWVFMQRRLNLRTIAVLLTGSAALLAAMQFILEHRNQGWFGEDSRPGYFKTLHVDDNFFRLGQIIELVPAEHPYVYLQQLFFIVIRPIPRYFWEGKPIDPGFNLPELIGITGVSLSTSMIGEWYLVWGMPTVLLGGLAMGLLCAAVNLVVVRSRKGGNAAVAAISLMVIFAALRSLQDLVLMSYAIMALLGVMALLRRAQRTRRRLSGSVKRGRRRRIHEALRPDFKGDRYPE